VQDKYLELETE